MTDELRGPLQGPDPFDPDADLCGCETFGPVITQGGRAWRCENCGKLWRPTGRDLAPLVLDVVRAWRDAGPRPDVHRYAIERLWQQWPSLAEAVSALADAHGPRE